ncbi:hypothetical protein BDQ17DRAFT_1413288 [Cyathus striatus]|nr:hypothetical protein BDQ17DRAFT_1413288 [Cyathus striatus]
MLLPLLPLQLTPLTHLPLTLCSENHRSPTCHTGNRHRITNPFPTQGDVGDVYVGACAIVEHGVYTGEGIGIEGREGGKYMFVGGDVRERARVQPAQGRKINPKSGGLENPNHCPRSQSTRGIVQQRKG